jgi:hypothetical protein
MANQHWLHHQQAIVDKELLAEMTSEHFTKKQVQKHTLNSITKHKKKQPTSKYPPQGKQLAVGTHQVKMTDCNAPVQTIHNNTRTDTRVKSRKVVYTVSWFEGDNTMTLHNSMTNSLWGSPLH